VARHSRLSVLTAALLLVLTACGARQGAASQPLPITSPTSSTTTTTTPSAPAGSATSGAGQDIRCTAALLAGSVETNEADPGSRYVTLVVRNTSKETCTLKGFGGLEMLSDTKEPIPTNAERNLSPAPTVVTLAPGATAGKFLRWSVVATGDEPTTGPCQPQAASINVTPPDETEAFEVNYALGAVCANGRLETSAYFAN
jgi:hypothetical protein